jgi:hypothetical protein
MPYMVHPRTIHRFVSTFCGTALLALAVPVAVPVAASDRGR